MKNNPNKQNVKKKQNKVSKNSGITFEIIYVIGNPGRGRREWEENILRDSGWEFFLK